MRQPQAANRLGQEVGSSLAGVQQDPLRVLETRREHKPGNPTAAAEVETSPGGFTEHEQSVDEAGAVVDLVVNRPRTEKAQVTGLLEDIAKCGQSLTGVITTRRRGSSPSEDVATPGMSFTVS